MILPSILWGNRIVDAMFLSIFASAPCEFAPPLLEVFRFFSNLVAHESTVRLVSVVLQVKTPIEYRVRSPCKKADGKMSPPAANLYFQLLLYFLRFGHLHFCTSSPGRHHPVKEVIRCAKKAFLKKSRCSRTQDHFQSNAFGEKTKQTLIFNCN